MARLYLFLSLVLLFPIRGYLQQVRPLSKEDSLFRIECPQKAVGDLFHKKDQTPKPPRKLSALILPNISSNPTNGFIAGVGGSLGWSFGSRENTNVSGAGFTVAYTSKNQLLTFVKSNLYTKHNTFFLQGDFRFYIYSQPTYGLGTNAPDTGNIPSSISWLGENMGEDDLSFPMLFNYVKIHEIVSRRVYEGVYVGIGYHLDYYYDIRDKNLRLDSVPALLTPHYVYSEKYGFHQDQYALSGLSANFVYDTRDNLICPYKGIYATVNYRYNFSFLGSDQDESSLWLEFRTYVGLSKKKPRNLIGFWVFGDFTMSGHQPYLTLPALGEDQRTRSGRGYANGRYRGDNMVYGEVEWRFPILPCSQILGGVLFVNAVTTSYKLRDVGLFEYICPSAGFGLRIMINKYFRTNLNLDFAIGKRSKGFYFSGQETF